AQVPVTGDLCQQGPADLGHVEREVGVLQDAEVELPLDVGQVVGVVAGGRVGQVERVVADAPSRFGNQVGIVNVRATEALLPLTHLRALQPVVELRGDDRVGNKGDLHASPSKVGEPASGSGSRPYFSGWAVASLIRKSMY